MILGKRLQNKTLHYCTYYNLKISLEEFEFKTYASYQESPIRIFTSQHMAKLHLPFQKQLGYVNSIEKFTMRSGNFWKCVPIGLPRWLKW